MSETASTHPRVPPRWFIRTAWVVHRGLYAITGGRFGLARPRPGKYGMLRLHTVGRRSGKPRVAILAYFEDGPNVILMAMNGWAEPHPAWWLNLRAHPEASVDMPGGSRRVRAREAQGVERERLWAGWDAYEDGTSMDDYATLRAKRTPVIVLEPVAG
ncbi:nitroreductase [Agrococcus baldri]|uniref:Nitroreductase n=2 Tax=Agrococcus baldri TaxID=153730 RepID=A0AA87RCR9_9MICO|nr:nitroreductase [Agrococcus baldri]